MNQTDLERKASCIAKKKREEREGEGEGEIGRTGDGQVSQWDSLFCGPGSVCRVSNSSVRGWRRRGMERVRVSRGRGEGNG